MEGLNIRYSIQRPQNFTSTKEYKPFDRYNNRIDRTDWSSGIFCMEASYRVDKIVSRIKASVNTEAFLVRNGDFYEKSAEKTDNRNYGQLESSA